VQGSQTDGRGRTGRLWLLAILAATAAVYLRALAGELVYDDLLLIARNPSITDLSSLPRLFTSGYWDFLDLREAQYIGYWRPLTAIVQALLWPVAELDPLPYHAVCLAAHLGATAAVNLVVLRLTGSSWIAAATALLFGLHPAHVESVAWISALNDPLFGCLALFSIERFLAWRAHGSRGLPLAALLLFSLALLAKELAAALVPLLVLLDLLRPAAPGTAPEGRRLFRLPDDAARAYGPFAAAFGLYLVARMLVFESPWAGFDRVTTDFGVGALRLALLRLELFGGALEILAVPVDLNLFRPFRPHLSPFDPALVRAVLFTGVYAALLVAALRRRARVAVAALLVIPCGLLPALIRVESLGIFPLSDRFCYLPVLGLALGVALLLHAALPRSTGTAVLLVLAGLFAARSVVRIGAWHDEETLFRTAAAQSPRSVYVQWGLGRVLLERMNATGDTRYLEEAERVYERAEALLNESKKEPTDLMVSSRDFLQVNLGLAWCAIYARDWAAAILMLEDVARRIEEIQERERQARERGLRVPQQFLDLDRVYTALGVARYKSGDFAGGERDFKHSLEIQPSAPETHQNLGRMYAEQGRWDLAAREFETAWRQRPASTEDRLLLAQALETLGESERAAELARALVEDLPGRAEPLVILAAGALRRQDSGAALTWLERAIALEPRNALAWYQKARALLQRQDAPGALAAFRNAVELDPTSFESHYDCGAFLLSQGAVAEARPYLVRAYELSPPQHRAALRRTLESMTITEPEVLLGLAAADAQRGELRPALAWTERCLAAAPGDGRAELERARLLRRLGRDEEAVAALRAVAEKAPASFELWSELATYLHSLGRTEEARPALEHALGLEIPASYPPGLGERSKERMRELLEGGDPNAKPEGER